MAESHQLAIEGRIRAFEIVDVLAMTPLSEVLLVRLARSARLAVMKRPRSEWRSEPVILERFRSERILGQQLRHAGLVRVLPGPATGGEPILMEYARGHTLRDELRRSGCLGARRAIFVVRQLCSALVYLHDRRIVHGSVRPEHVWWTPGDRVQLLDLGGVRVLPGGEFRPRPARSTREDVYSAPEQLRRRQPDEASDVYGAGAVLYELVTGVAPYAGIEQHALARAKHDLDLVPPGALRPLDAALEQIVLSATARDRRRRYPSIGALVRDLADPGAAMRRVECLEARSTGAAAGD